ncbi:MAG: hypothetical protein LC114_04610 [Bryobacterales bacterium]|nr:hypothetical protein [Bryobacterales bacterium]
MNANELISRMTEIEGEMHGHEQALANLRSEGQSLFSQFEDWRKGLRFAPAAAVPAPASKTDADRKDDLKTAFKLAIKRAIQKAKDGGSTIEAAVALAGATAMKVAEKKGVEVPTWIGGWTETQIEKAFPQPQGDAPAAEISESKEIESVPTDAVKPVRRRKK